MINKTYRVQLIIVLMSILLLLAACGPTVNQIKPQQTITVNQGFQQELTPIPTVPPYRCGAWAANNVPGAYSSVSIYARLTNDVSNGVPGIRATAVAHLKIGDVPINGQLISDASGYVTFDFALAGQQPRLIPATIEVTFNTPGSSTTCSAFFTPQ